MNEYEEERERMLTLMQVACDHDSASIRDAIANTPDIFGDSVHHPSRQAALMVLADLSGGVFNVVNDDGDLGDVFVLFGSRLLTWVSGLSGDPIPVAALAEVLDTWALLESRGLET